VPELVLIRDTARQSPTSRAGRSARLKLKLSETVSGALVVSLEDIVDGAHGTDGHLDTLGPLSSLRPLGHHVD
jgi:hypothetical protein